MNTPQFGVKRSRSQWNKVCWKQLFLALLTRESDFLQTYSDVLWDRDGCVKFLRQKRSQFKVKVEQHALEPSLYRWRHTVLDISMSMSMSINYLYSANGRKSNLRRWRVSD